MEEWENVLDEDGKPQFDEEHKLVRKLKKKYHNPLKEIYGEYIPDLKPYKKALGLQPDTDEWFKVKTLEDLRLAILDYEKGCKPEDKLNWEAPDLSGYKDKSEIDTGISMVDAKSPWYHLLVHPKVAESASNMYNGAKETRASIMQTTQTGLDLYQNAASHKTVYQHHDEQACPGHGLRGRWGHYQRGQAAAPFDAGRISTAPEDGAD